MGGPYLSTFFVHPPLTNQMAKDNNKDKDKDNNKDKDKDKDKDNDNDNDELQLPQQVLITNLKNS